MEAQRSYRLKHLARWRKDETALRKLADPSKHESTWDELRDLPAGRVQRDVDYGVEVCSAGQQELACTFWQRAAATADRLIAENRYLDTAVAEAAHPAELAAIIRGRAYARWLLGQPLDRGALRQAARYFVEWCLTKAEDRKRFCEPGMTMDDYLNGVRAAIIGCDLDFAGEALGTKQPFRWHFAEEKVLLSRLVDEHPELTDAFDRSFEDFFDRVRDPDFHDGEGVDRKVIHRESLVLDAGIIREMYIVNASPHDDPNPQSVIEAIAR